ncbi:MAG: phage holin family protein [Gemmatimonadetes bacterium]|nr:MAG: phage holin family protein [Gemmatimonadota bacterium]
MIEFVVHVLVSAGLLYVVGQMISGIDVRDGRAALFGALGLGLVNAFVKPILVFLTLPVTFLTLGLFLIVVNALMFMLAAALVDGFEVEGFGAALKGSLTLAVMNFVVGAVFGL